MGDANSKEMGKECFITKSKAGILKGVISMQDELGKHILREKGGPGGWPARYKTDSECRIHHPALQSSPW